MNTYPCYLRLIMTRLDFTPSRPTPHARLILGLGWLACMIGPTTAREAAGQESVPITITAGVVTLSEQVAVAAAESGILDEVQVRPGQLVPADAPIARLRDEDAELLVERTRTLADIAARQADNELDELHATKSTEVARAELARSIEANVKYPKTVSRTDLDRQRLLVEQGELEIRRAQQDRLIAELNRAVKENEYQLAKHQWALRRLSAPIPGMVVEVFRQPGEWVQPGDIVARIIRLDRLRVEGFLPATQGRLSLVGRPVRVEAMGDDGESLSLPGEVVFVSPEIDPINLQVRVWVEVANEALSLRPGMTATATVLEP